MNGPQELYDKVAAATGLSPHEEFGIDDLRVAPAPRGTVEMIESPPGKFQGSLVLMNTFPIPEAGVEILFGDNEKPKTESALIRKCLKGSIEAMKSFLDDLSHHLDRMAETENAEVTNG